MSNTDIRECIIFTELLRKPRRNNGNNRIKIIYRTRLNNLYRYYYFRRNGGEMYRSLDKYILCINIYKMII
jgi:hypothetical protein